VWWVLSRNQKHAAPAANGTGRWIGRAVLLRDLEDYENEVRHGQELTDMARRQRMIGPEKRSQQL